MPFKFFNYSLDGISRIALKKNMPNFTRLKMIFVLLRKKTVATNSFWKQKQILCVILKTGKTNICKRNPTV